MGKRNKRTSVQPPAHHDNLALPKLDFEPERYRKHLKNTELNRAQEDELLRVLWEIMRTMVDLGWGVDNIQSFLPNIFEKAGTDCGKLLERNYTPSPEHNTKATPDTE